MSEWGASARFAVLKPLAAVGNHEVHCRAFVVLQLDPDCVRVGQPDMRADGDCPEASPVAAKLVEQYGKVCGGGVGARICAEHLHLPARAHCCAERMQLCPLLHHPRSGQEHHVQQAIKIVLTLLGGRVSPRRAIAPDLPPPWVPTRRHEFIVRARLCPWAMAPVGQGIPVTTSLATRRW